MVVAPQRKSVGYTLKVTTMKGKEREAYDIHNLNSIEEVAIRMTQELRLTNNRKRDSLFMSVEFPR